MVTTRRFSKMPRKSCEDDEDMATKRPLQFLALALIFISASLGTAPAPGSLMAQMEGTTDGEIYRIQPSPGPVGIREHFGNPEFFMKYLIKVPPVYV